MSSTSKGFRPWNCPPRVLPANSIAGLSKADSKKSVEQTEAETGQREAHEQAKESSGSPLPKHV